MLLVSSAKKTLQLVDTAAKQAVPFALDAKTFKTCQFSPDGNYVYVTAADAEELLILDLKGNKLFGKVAFAGAQPSKVTEIFVHPNASKRLALGVSGSQVFYLDTAAHKQIGAALSFGVPIQSLAFHPNGTHFFALAYDKVFVVELQSRATQKTLELAAGSFFRGLVVDSQGKRLFVVGNHETDGGVGAILNKEGKEFATIDLDTGKRAYHAFPPVQAVQFLITP